MNTVETLTVLSLVTMSISFAIIAVSLWSLSASASKLLPVLIRYLSKMFVHDPVPHHGSLAVTRDLVVWEWRGSHWALRPESGPIELAGASPSWPGDYESQCVTTQRSVTRV